MGHRPVGLLVQSVITTLHVPTAELLFLQTMSGQKVPPYPQVIRRFPQVTVDRVTYQAAHTYYLSRRVPIPCSTS